MTTGTVGMVNSPRMRGRKRMATTSDAQRRAVAKYKKDKTKNLTIRFYPTDMEVLEHIKSHENISQYIKGLVLADMNKQQ